MHRRAVAVENVRPGCALRGAVEAFDPIVLTAAQSRVGVVRICRDTVKGRDGEVAVDVSPLNGIGEVAVKPPNPAVVADHEPALHVQRHRMVVGVRPVTVCPDRNVGPGCTAVGCLQEVLLMRSGAAFLSAHVHFVRVGGHGKDGRIVPSLIAQVIRRRCNRRPGIAAVLAFIDFQQPLGKRIRDGGIEGSLGIGNLDVAIARDPGREVPRGELPASAIIDGRACRRFRDGDGRRIGEGRLDQRHLYIGHGPAEGDVEHQRGGGAGGVHSNVDPAADGADS